MNKETLLEVQGISKHYTIGRTRLEVLRQVSFSLTRGSWTTLLGASGSGKTTLLNILGTLETPDAGEVFYAGSGYRQLSARHKNRFRNRNIGFIFQFYHLLPELTLLQNVMLPGMLNRLPGKALLQRAEELLELVGLMNRRLHYPNELSGGEQQRAAIARALLNRPQLILADEPTGNLDSHTGSEILEIFQQLHKQDSEVTIFMITHSREVAGLADDVIYLRDGMLTAATDYNEAVLRD